ncbi:MAG: D-tyrosyl-tRNA(Tyr) deacylase [Candidatus Omnitrophota bacterium]|nr:MAG: D-tyrosyl-tRNA(Tyr) deacylase [Candidatus Omnitrophota bacterium]
MRAVIQRVNTASVTVNQKIVAKIKKGLVIFLGVLKEDGLPDAEYLAKKIAQLRLFSDQNRKMNLSACDVQAEILAVSQFTLCSDITDSGRRPSFDKAAPSEKAEKLYLEFIAHLEKAGLKVSQGVFKEYMTVHIENDGPVTFVLDSKKA